MLVIVLALMLAACIVAIAVLAIELSGRSLACEYGALLGRECWVKERDGESWTTCVVIAVSWKGAIRVRSVDSIDHGGFWVGRESVGNRVKFGGAYGVR